MNANELSDWLQGRKITSIEQGNTHGWMLLHLSHHATNPPEAKEFLTVFVGHTLRDEHTWTCALHLYEHNTIIPIRDHRNADPTHRAAISSKDITEFGPMIVNNTITRVEAGNTPGWILIHMGNGFLTVFVGGTKAENKYQHYHCLCALHCRRDPEDAKHIYAVRDYQAKDLAIGNARKVETITSDFLTVSPEQLLAALRV